MLLTSRNFAIGRAHYQIAGGGKTMMLLAIAYILAAGTVLGLLAYNEAPRPAYRAVATLATVAQALLLVIIGGVRVGGCMRSDVVTRMIDSHRLMPVESWRAILGYIGGATSHVMLLTVLNVVFVATLLGFTGLSFGEFVINQLVLGIFSLFVWSFAAMCALMSRQVMPVVIIAFIFGGFFSVASREFAILPALSILASPFLGETVFNLARAAGAVRDSYPLALTAQIAYATLFFIGACRRYRGSYPSTFSVWQGMALCLVWALTSVAAIDLWQGSHMFWRVDRVPGALQIVAAVVVSALLAIVPVHAMVAIETRRDRPLPLWRIAAALAGITLISTLATVAAPRIGINEFTGKAFLTLLILTGHVLTIYLALRATRHMTQMTRGIFVTAVLFFVWLVPLLLEVVRWLFTPEAVIQQNESATIGILGSLSPLGLLLTHWMQPSPPPALVGLAFQVFIVACLYALLPRLERNTTGTAQ